MEIGGKKEKHIKVFFFKVSLLYTDIAFRLAESNLLQIL